MTKKHTETTGEIRRVFLKHKVYGTLHVVDIDDRGVVLAAVDISEPTACAHRLPDYVLSADGCEMFNDHMRDFETVDQPCSDPTHLLADIGAAEVECQAAQSEWEIAHRHAKSLKEIFDSKQDRLRQIVREATTPKPMPLFDSTAA